ncbi:MAG: AGE family epimerase/isomerase [Pikeienuella sp.]|uniref:AGE family epimerase/isomerase n=1 Tax=Pikeienuella sp. TaxID=2831957 RepID=UPI00391AF5EF
MRPARAEALPGWFRDEALPLWRGAGVDREGFGVFEALDHEGRPLPQTPKRLRVQLRQVFVLATASRIWGTGDLKLAEALFAAVLERGFEPGSGALASLMARDGTILAAPHDLYDVAFLLLAEAALKRAGAAPGETGAAALARLRAPRGWRERLGEPAIPRGQNAHMHLFEAATAKAEAGDEAWLSVAEECLALFRGAFLGPDGAVREFFDADWRPLSAGQRVEPGHVAEWIVLIDHWERLTGRASGVDLAPLWRFVERETGADGLLPDASEPREESRRLWPQTERFRAARVAARRLGAAEDLSALPFAPYLATPAPGGWFDRLDASGRVTSSVMPASTAYHIALACLAEMDHQGAATRKKRDRRPEP